MESERKTISYWYTDGPENPEDYFVYKWLCEKYDVVLDEVDPQFLFYGVAGDNHLKYTSSVKVFIPTETEMPNFNQCDYAVGFSDMRYSDRYFYHNYALDVLTSDILDRSAVTDDLVNRKFCNFIYSNASSGEGALLRQEFCKRLMRYKHVDCPGKVLNNMDNSVVNARFSGDWTTGKINFQKQYKFSIAFENESFDGWVTEKLFHPLRALSVPIYYGSPSVNRDFNPKAFVNLADYDFDLDRLVERIVYLDTHDDEYLAMLREKPLQDDFRYYDETKFKEWIFHIIDKGCRPFIKDPRHVAADKKMMAKGNEWYRNYLGIKDTSLVGKLRDIIQATQISGSVLENKLSENQALLRLLVRDHLKKKYHFRLLRYRLLKHITFGATKKKYKEKYNTLKNKIQNGG